MSPTNEEDHGEVPQTPPPADRPADQLIDEASRLILRLKDMPDDPATQAEMAVWRRQSPQHARAWMTAQKVWGLAGQIGADHPVFGAPAAAVRQPVVTRRRMTMGISVAAAACLAVIAAPSISLLWQADYRTDVGESRTIALPDGSTVQLDTGTAIALLDEAEGRGVKLLSGRAWFDVAKDDDDPFRVAASDVTVTVTGTQFDVGLTDSAIEVALAEGAVRASYPAEPGGVNLSPGDRFRFDRSSQRAQMASVPVDSIAAWRRGKLRIEGATIADIVDRIRPYYSGKIIITDDDFASQRVTGTFDISDPVAALRTVVEPHAGRVSTITPLIVFVSAP